MKRKGIAAIIALSFLICLLAGAGSCLAQPQPPSANSDSSDHPKICKLGKYTGTIPLSQLPYYFAGEEDLRGGMTCTFRVHSALPPFTLHFAGQPDNSFGDIDITEGTSTTVVQNIDKTPDASAIPLGTAAQTVLTIVDANFDGYSDLQVLSNCGATGNCSYDFYIYDPVSSQFVHDDFLSSLGTPSFDVPRKQVTSSGNGSVSDWQKEIYQFENGQYRLIHKEVSTWDRAKNLVTVNTYELRNGHMELIDSETSPQ